MTQRQGQNEGPQPWKPDAVTIYAVFSELIYANQPLADTLAAMSVLARRVLDEAWETSLTLVEGRRQWTAVHSGPLALELDQWQHDNGGGPCLDAASSRTTIELTVAEPDQPYPEFRRAARERGVTHAISVGLATGNQIRGALNLYSSSGRPFSEHSDRTVRSFSYCAGILLAHVERYRVAASRAARVEVALQSRSLIERAKGLLMARYRCTSEDAFAMLIELARARNVKLEVVVRSIVDDAT